MSRIEFKRKQRKDSGSLLWQTPDGSQVFVGRDYALQNEIDEVKETTRGRACFKECRTCGACANSARDCTHTKTYDANARKMIDCRKCERFRFHDCHNGVMRNSHQDAEPFTEEQEKLIKQSGGKPLI